MTITFELIPGFFPNILLFLQWSHGLGGKTQRMLAAPPAWGSPYMRNLPGLCCPEEVAKELQGFLGVVALDHPQPFTSCRFVCVQLKE